VYTLDQAKKLMVRHLKSFAVYDDAPSYKTTFSDVLPDDDGYGISTSKRLFKGVMIRDLVNAGHDKKKCTNWPKKWADMNINTLVPKLIGETL